MAALVSQINLQILLYQCFTTKHDHFITERLFGGRRWEFPDIHLTFGIHCLSYLRTFLKNIQLQQCLVW